MVQSCRRKEVVVTQNFLLAVVISDPTLVIAFMVLVLKIVEATRSK